MTEHEKANFVDEMLREIKLDLHKKIQETAPEEWDGIELRWLVADTAARWARFGMGDKRRRAAYKNSVLVNNL